ncbi:MAG: SAM-dependent methyltransferase [Gammaproteobacteria bacterium]|nr:SAM-dependent methyltransferase [Gammaproteobacteria bacterium]
MAKRGSSRRWLREHREDDFVQKAIRSGYRSRAVFKLEEIDRRDQLFSAGMGVVDLGAAPGSWSQYAAAKVGPQGWVVAIDILPMAALPDVSVIQGDFADNQVFAELLKYAESYPISVVMSDMSPNLSGVNAVDQARATYLAEMALDFARRSLMPGGAFLAKAFHGDGFDAFVADARASFRRVRVRKPRASRPRSREVYVLGKDYSV